MAAEVVTRAELPENPHTAAVRDFLSQSSGTGPTDPGHFGPEGPPVGAFLGVPSTLFSPEDSEEKDPWTPDTPGVPPSDDPSREKGEEEPSDEEKKRIEEMSKGGKFKPQDEKYPGEPAASARCCVSSFLYPTEEKDLPPEPGSAHRSHWTDKPGSGKIPRGPRISAVLLAFSFKVKAVFLPTGNCDCNCCLFAQYVVQDDLTLTRLNREGAEPQSLTQDEPYLDCYWEVLYKDEEGRRHTVNVRTGPSWRAPSESDLKKIEGVAEIFHISGPHCVGSKRRPEKKPLILEPGYGTYSDSGCKFDLYDSPARSVPRGMKVTWTWASAGVIHDICNQYVIRRAKDFKRVESGELSAKGEWTPAGEPKWTKG